MDLSETEPPSAEQWVQLLARIGNTYEGFDQDRELVERSLEISSKELQEQRAQIVLSSKMSALGEMAGGIAHEINTPLNIFTMYAELLLEMAGQNRSDLSLVRDAAITINETAIRIGTIVQGLRNFSRGDDSEAMRKVNFSSVLGDTLVLCRNNFEMLGISLEIGEVPDSLIVECREIAISQVLLNLLNNAKDALENQEKKWIHIECEKVNNFLKCSVTDSGSGIPIELREKLMQPFFTTKESGKGTGLGLSISKGIIESHCGTFVYDEKCSNTRFVFWLPLLQTYSQRRAA
jgi:C4-dicarboxylate-specific signal transduction histidine kinase